MPQRHTAHVREDGTLPESWHTFFRDTYLPQYAGREISMGPPPATQDQRGYLFGLVYRVIKEGLHAAGITRLPLILPGGVECSIPVTRDFLHIYFKAIYTADDTTKGMDTTEMHEYVEAIRQDELVLQAGIYVPDPDPDWKKKQPR